MGLVPFLQPQVILNPHGSGLMDDDKIKNNTLLLVDAGYKDNMMLEEAMRDGFDVIFLLDVHGLKPTLNKFILKDLHGKFAWAKLLRNCFHVLTNANSVKSFRLTDRANEEIVIRDEMVDLAKQLPDMHAQALYKIIHRMNTGRLRLGDKKKAQIYMVANEAYSTLFNFANFKTEEPRELMTAGWMAAVEVLESLGFDTNIVKPVFHEK